MLNSSRTTYNLNFKLKTDQTDHCAVRKVVWILLWNQDLKEQTQQTEVVETFVLQLSIWEWVEDAAYDEWWWSLVQLSSSFQAQMWDAYYRVKRREWTVGYID